MAQVADLVTALQNAVQAVNTLNTTLKATYTQISNTVASTASPGSATLPSAPVAFAQVTIASVQYKIPLYLP